MNQSRMSTRPASRPHEGRLAPAFSSEVEVRLAREGIEVAVYDLWIVDFLDCREGLRFDGSPDALSVADLRIFGDLGNGTGGRVLRAALALADEWGVTLVLNPQASSRTLEGALSQEELEDWYARLGFVWEKPLEAHLMAREPGTPIPEPTADRAEAPSFRA